MVPWTIDMPLHQTTYDYGSGDEGTTTKTEFHFVATTCTEAFERAQRRLEEEAEEEAEVALQAKQVEHMRSFWRDDLDRHQFQRHQFVPDRRKRQRRRPVGF